MAFSVYPLKLYLRRLPNAVLLLASLFLNLLIWIWLLWHIRPVEDPIYLHYNILFGIDLTGAWYRVFILPITGIFIFFLNAILGWLLFNKDKLIAYLLNAIILLVHLFLLVAASLVVFLNV